MRAVASEHNPASAGNGVTRRSPARRWTLLALTLVANTVMTYYYTAVADVTNVAVLTVGLIVLWAVWIGLLIATLVTRPGTRADRIALSAAPACVAISIALYFLT